MAYKGMSQYDRMSHIICLCEEIHMSYLFRSVKECHDLTACAVVVDHEFSFVHAGCIAGRYLLLGTPKDSLIEDMVRRDILER